MNILKLSKAAFLAAAVNCYPAEQNYVEVNDFQKWKYDAQWDTNTLSSIGTQIPSVFDAYTTDGSKIIFSAVGPMFRTDDGLLYLLDNDKVTIDPENLVKGIAVDVYTILPGKYYFDFTVLNTNDNVIAKVTKEKSFPRTAFNSSANATNRMISVGIESENTDIDKLIVSVDNETNKVKRFSLNNLRFIDKMTSITNSITVIEGLTYFLQSNIQGNSFTWYKDGQLLKHATNSFLELDYAVEGDEGQYVVQSGAFATILNVSFKKSVKLVVNGREIEDYLDGNGKVEITPGSKVSLVTFIDGLPVRYTLDGTEPTEKSLLYISPITINKAAYLRARIYIPETDSTRIKISANND